MCLEWGVGQLERRVKGSVLGEGGGRSGKALYRTEEAGGAQWKGLSTVWEQKGLGESRGRAAGTAEAGCVHGCVHGRTTRRPWSRPGTQRPRPADRPGGRCPARRRPACRARAGSAGGKRPAICHESPPQESIVSICWHRRAARSSTSGRRKGFRAMQKHPRRVSWQCHIALWDVNPAALTPATPSLCIPCSPL